MNEPTLRYWKRPGKDGIIYYATATNAGHARAEADTTATEITYDEYDANVPPQVHNGADRNEPPRAAAPGDPVLAKQAAWSALQTWTAQHGDNVAIQDQIAMLELWKHQLCTWATASIAEAHIAQAAAEKTNVN